MNTVHPEIFDYIIVGAGSSGCVLANRLSANPSKSVLLIEAGRDFDPGREPEFIRDAGGRAKRAPYVWNDTTDERGKQIPTGKVIGGGSNINGLHAQRGLPRDYDGWSELGAQGWDWQGVLPYFKKMENDIDFRGPLHGADGGIEIRRTPSEKWSALSRALRESLDAEGLPRIDDLNAAGGDGSAPLPMNRGTHTRSSTAMAYLDAPTRSRPNLRIMANTQVRRVVFTGRRTSGVELEGGQHIAGRNVVLSAGALKSPLLLLRSGVGGAAQLQAAGIALVADRPGVGRNLRHHCNLFVSAHLKRHARQYNFREVRPKVNMLARFSSQVAGCESTDMSVALFERLMTPLYNDPLGMQLANFLIIITRAYSHGELTLDPAQPFGPARINSQLLSDARDVARIEVGFQKICRLIGQAPIAPMVNEVFISNALLDGPKSILTTKLLQGGWQGQLVSHVGAFVADFVPVIGRRFIRSGGLDVSAILAQSPEQRAETLRRAAAPSAHPAGTCRLGAPNDPDAVVDPQCRVIGVEGLWVVDASIFPTLMTGGPSLPTIMAGEKGADLVLQTS